jgi:large subunit ribosomal protein L18
MKVNKKTARLRRGLRTRKRIVELNKDRLCIHRTARHIYAQIIAADNTRVLACASTLDKELRTELDAGNTGNVAAAEKVGALIASRAQAANVSEVAFDRSGFKYHGRVKAVAEAARQQGLKF